MICLLIQIKDDFPHQLSVIFNNRYFLRQTCGSKITSIVFILNHFSQRFYSESFHFWSMSSSRLKNCIFIFPFLMSILKPFHLSMYTAWWLLYSGDSQKRKDDLFSVWPCANKVARTLIPLIT